MMWSPFGTIVSSISFVVALGIILFAIEVLKLFDWNVL